METSPTHPHVGAAARSGAFDRERAERLAQRLRPPWARSRAPARFELPSSDGASDGAPLVPLRAIILEDTGSLEDGPGRGVTSPLCAPPIEPYESATSSRGWTAPSSELAPPLLPLARRISIGVFVASVAAGALLGVWHWRGTVVHWLDALGTQLIGDFLEEPPSGDAEPRRDPPGTAPLDVPAPPPPEQAQDGGSPTTSSDVQTPPDAAPPKPPEGAARPSTRERSPASDAPSKRSSAAPERSSRTSDDDGTRSHPAPPRSSAAAPRGASSDIASTPASRAPASRAVPSRAVPSRTVPSQTVPSREQPSRAAPSHTAPPRTAPTSDIVREAPF